MLAYLETMQACLHSCLFKGSLPVWLALLFWNSVSTTSPAAPLTPDKLIACLVASRVLAVNEPHLLWIGLIMSDPSKVYRQ